MGKPDYATDIWQCPWF